MSNRILAVTLGAAMATSPEIALAQEAQEGTDGSQEQAVNAGQQLPAQSPPLTLDIKDESTPIVDHATPAPAIDPNALQQVRKDALAVLADIKVILKSPTPTPTLEFTGVVAPQLTLSFNKTQKPQEDFTAGLKQLTAMVDAQKPPFGAFVYTDFAPLVEGEKAENPLQRAWVSLEPVPEFQVRAGYIASPFGQYRHPFPHENIPASYPDLHIREPFVSFGAAASINYPEEITTDIAVLSGKNIPDGTFDPHLATRVQANIPPIAKTGFEISIGDQDQTMGVYTDVATVNHIFQSSIEALMGRVEQGKITGEDSYSAGVTALFALTPVPEVTGYVRGGFVLDSYAHARLSTDTSLTTGINVKPSTGMTIRTEVNGTKLSGPHRRTDLNVVGQFVF